MTWDVVPFVVVAVVGGNFGGGDVGWWDLWYETMVGCCCGDH